MVTQSPPYTHTTGDFAYYTLPATPLFHAFVDLDENFTINIILWNGIRCISSPTNQQCEAYTLDGRPHSNQLDSVNLYSVIVQSNILVCYKNNLYVITDHARTTEQIENTVNLGKHSCTHMQ